MRIVSATTTKHVPAIARLMASSRLLRRYAVTDRSARRSLLEGLRAGDILLVAIDGAAVVGLAWLIPSRALDRSAYLRLLLVAEGRTSDGIGSALLEAGERRARSRGARHVTLLVTADNRRARAFYERHGYHRVGILKDFVRRGIDEALYARSLD